MKVNYYCRLHEIIAFSNINICQIKACNLLFTTVRRRGEDQYIWTAWFAWLLILVRMWNVLFADNIAMILNIEVRYMLDAVRAGFT